jgi:serine protease Do
MHLRIVPLTLPIGLRLALAVVAVAALLSAPSSHGEEQSVAVAAVNDLSNAFAAVADKASPAVVFIQVEKEFKRMPAAFEGPEWTPFGPDEFFRFFFGPSGPEMDRGERPRMRMPRQFMRGEGSGFIISRDGYIVTNHHVVGEADRVNVTLADGREFTARLVGSDPATEIALVKIDADDLPHLKLGDSDELRVGEWVLAIGNPFGLSHTVTSGIVSARGRGNVGIVDYADFIQTDAAINPGNSGGPLLNMKGDVVGMNTAIMSRAGGSDGVGFAIPVNMVKSIVDQLREHGTVSYGFMGVSIQEVTPDLAKWFKLDEGNGIVISEVSPESPADRAGLRPEDIILKFDGKPVGEAGAFRSWVASTKPGTEITLTILRDGQRIEKRIALGNRPGEMLARRDSEAAAPTPLGLSVEPLTNALAQRLGYEGESGVVVSEVEPGTAAEDSGLRPGVLIKQVNRRDVHNPREFEEAINDGKDNKSALLLIKEGRGSRYVTLDLA